VAFAQRRGGDAPRLLLQAAERLEALDPALARETYLEALGAALTAGDFSAGSVTLSGAISGFTQRGPELDMLAPGGPRADDGIDRVHLLDDPMYVALPRRHPLADKRNLRIEELAHESWILGTLGACPDASIFLRLCARSGFEPKIAFTSDDYNAVQGFVAAGVGASLIPDLALISLRDDIVVRSLLPAPPARRIYAATLHGSFVSPAKQAMLDTLVEVGAEFATGRRELALAV